MDWVREIHLLKVTTQLSLPLPQLSPHLLFTSQGDWKQGPQGQAGWVGHAGLRVRVPGCPPGHSRPVSCPSRLSRTWSCRRKPELGQISRCACTVWMASTSVMFSQIMRKARTTVAERLTPMAQCTSTRPAGRPNLASATCSHTACPLGNQGCFCPPSTASWSTDTVLIVIWGN